MPSFFLVSRLLAMEVSMPWAILLGISPLAGTLAYILTLKRGKPKGYDRDFITKLLGGSSGSLRDKKQPEHPNSF